MRLVFTAASCIFMNRLTGGTVQRYNRELLFSFGRSERKALAVGGAVAVSGAVAVMLYNRLPCGFAHLDFYYYNGYLSRINMKQMIEMTFT